MFGGQIPENGQGLIEGVPNTEYHAAPGCSKSMLDFVHQSPALLEWYRRAPVDHDAKKAIDLGSAFEALLLEPDRFNAEYVVAPNVDRRTTAGKTAWAAFVEEAKDKHVLDADTMTQIKFMVGSTLAHPMVERVLESENIVQGSYWWTDPVTDALCRCRPDILCKDVPMVVDIKTTADMKWLRRSVADYRYHVQDAFYSDGLTNYYEGEQPHFLFVFVCTSLNAGRYPVHVMELDIDAKHQGVNEYRSDLERYLQCLEADDWTHIEELHLPRWARETSDL